MKSVKILTAVVLAAVLSGCVMPRGKSGGRLSEIPEYREGSVKFDTGAKIVVAGGLRTSPQLERALKNYGCTVLDSTQKYTPQVNAADFVAEPLTFRNVTEVYQGRLYLFSRVSVMVREPVHLDDNGFKEKFKRKPRVFHAGARTDLGFRSAAVEADYRAGEGRAMNNLMLVPEFRQALTR